MQAEYAGDASQPPRYRWEQVASQAAFAPRDGAGALTFKGRMWLIGGWNQYDKNAFPKLCVNDVWSSSDGVAWTREKPDTFRDGLFDPARDWEGRHTAGYVVFRDRMWIVGGDPLQGHIQNDVWNSADGRNWSRVTPRVPWSPRVLHYTVVFKDKIWVMGGQTIPQFAPADEVFYNDVWVTSDGINWEKVPAQGPRWSPRGMIGGSVVFKDRMWILGGGTYDTPQTPTRKFYNDVWSSADGIHWECHTEHAPWAPRQYHDVAVFDGCMWVMEGYNAEGGNRKDVWYSADGIHWQEVPGTPWAPRHAASVFVYADALWVVSGNNLRSDVWKIGKSRESE